METVKQKKVQTTKNQRHQPDPYLTTVKDTGTGYGNGIYATDESRIWLGRLGSMDSILAPHLPLPRDH